MTQEEIEKLAEKNIKLTHSHSSDSILNFKEGYIIGYKAALSMLNVMQSKKFDIYSQGYLDGMRIKLKASFTEQEIRDAYQNYDDGEGWFECADFLIKELKKNQIETTRFLNQNK